MMAGWTNRHRDIMGDVYRMLQRNFMPTRGEAYWNKLIAEGNEICAKYDYDELAMDMVAAVNLHLENKLKRIEQGIEQ